MDETVTILEQLHEVSLDQHGLVTSEQAAAKSIPRQKLVELAIRGRLERLQRGIYRFPQAPGSRYQNWELAVLWTGVPEACLSYETALAAWGIAWDIGGVNPAQIHVTVGRLRRIRREGGEDYRIHHEDLTEQQRTWIEQVPITDVPTTIRQCITWGTSTGLIKRALERASVTGQLLKPDTERLTRQLKDRDHERRSGPTIRRARSVG